jgi:hypothetical protein
MVTAGGAGAHVDAVGVETAAGFDPQPFKTRENTTHRRNAFPLLIIPSQNERRRNKKSTPDMKPFCGIESS